MMIENIADNLYLKDGLWVSKSKQEISYPETGNQACAQLEEDSFWFNHRNKCILSVLKKYGKQDTFFDVGGGNGFVAKYLADHGTPIVLVEPGMTGALNARTKGLQNIICSSLEDAGFKENIMGAVGLFDVVEHIEDDYAFLSNINTYLQQDGIVLITVPAFNFLWSKEDDDAGHFRRYTMRSIRKVLSGAGYTVEYDTYIFSFLPLPVLLFRTIPSLFNKGRKSDDLNKHKKEHAMKKGFFSRVLNWILKQELALIARGKRIPIGGSCLIVARKR